MDLYKIEEKLRKTQEYINKVRTELQHDLRQLETFQYILSHMVSHIEQTKSIKTYNNAKVEYIRQLVLAEACAVYNLVVEQYNDHIRYMQSRLHPLEMIEIPAVTAEPGPQPPPAQNN